MFRNEKRYIQHHKEEVCWTCLKQPSTVYIFDTKHPDVYIFCQKCFDNENIELYKDDLRITLIEAKNKIMTYLLLE